MCRCPLMNSDIQVPEDVLEGNKYRIGNVWRST